MGRRFKGVGPPIADQLKRAIIAPPSVTERTTNLLGDKKAPAISPNDGLERALAADRNQRTSDRQFAGDEVVTPS